MKHHSFTTFLVMLLSLVGVRAFAYDAVDVTSLITNPSFDTNTAFGWEGDAPGFQSYNNAEFFHRTFDFHQTLSGLTNGKYLLKVKAFQRPGFNQDVYVAYMKGNADTQAELYANNESIKLAHQCSGARNSNDFGGAEVSFMGQKQYVPNSMLETRTWFDASEGYYENELPVYVTDGSLTIGIRLNKMIWNEWVIFDDFRLEYLGENITFTDDKVKTLCLENWDTNGNGMLSMTEASAVTNFGEVFKSNNQIVSFDELYCFTGLSTIGNNSFYGCNNLASITLPSSVTSIGNSAFSGCSNLVSITIPSDVTSIGTSSFENCVNLSTVFLPSSLTTIGSNAFRGCISLNTITFPNSVTTIGNDAFSSCTQLNSIHLLSNVTTIGNSAFYGCNSLTNVIVDSNTPASITSNVFSNRANATLFIPAGSKTAYEASSYWSEFGRVAEMADIAEGIYYLKNVETGRYLDQGNFWGTHAILNNIGLPARIAKQNDGSYTITFTEGSQLLRQLFRDIDDEAIPDDAVHVDYKGQIKGCPFWTITKAETNGNYYIQTLVSHDLYGQAVYPNTFLGNNPTKEATDNDGIPLGVFNDVDGNVTATEGNNIIWQLIPESDRCTRFQMSQLQALINLAQTLGISITEIEAIAGNASKQQATTAIASLKTSIVQSLANGVSADKLPLDMTALMINPSFISDNSDGWEGDTPTFESFNNAEFFQKSFDIHQTVSNLPKGKYLLKVKGYHRPGGNQNVYTSYKQGNTETKGELYANNDFVKLAHQSSGARNTNTFAGVEVSYNEQIQFVPNSLSAARKWFDSREGYYENEVTTYVTNSSLTLGIRLSELTTEGWVVFDDFRLEYLGAVAGIKMGANGIATYSNSCDLNFTSVSGLKAYIGSGYNPATGDLTMTRVYEVPAGEGLILKGAADSYEVPYEETSAYYANLLVGVPTTTTVNPTDGDYTNFILANDELKVIGFYPLASAGEIGPNKAYLQLPTSILPPASARQFRMVFEDEEEGTTGISASLNNKGQMMNDKPIFDLQGRRVVKPTRGLYIKDGKKIMVK